MADFEDWVRRALVAMCATTACSSDRAPNPDEPFATSIARVTVAAVNVFTHHGDNQRTGENLLETILTTSNVQQAGFGKLFTLPVDDQIYAQPLYASQLSIVGGTHNVVFVATMSNSVYAFDADIAGPPLWNASFNGSGIPLDHTQVGQSCGTYMDITGHIGILGTPAIDPVSGTMYFVARTFENSSFVQRLHAIDITSGLERGNGPAVIQATVTGTGEGGDGSHVVFNPQTQNQRTALAVSQGRVFIAWASHCDTRPYHGWVMTYDAASLAQVAVYNNTPNGTMGGIWQAGSGPVVDPDGNIYYTSGNGDWDGVTAFGETVTQLSPQTLAVTDFFTPFDWNSLNAGDLDLGSTGPMLFPGTDLLVTGSKTGKLYVINRRRMGKVASNDGELPQWFQATTGSPTHHIHGGEVAWSANPNGPSLYVWGENDFLREFTFQPSSGAFDVAPTAVGQVLAPSGMPGGMLSVSANGGTLGSGVVWASLPSQGNANQATVPGVLRAFDASNLTELWNSTRVAADAVGTFAKFVPPTIANGKVYLATFSNRLNVYGLVAAGADGGVPDTGAEIADSGSPGAGLPGTPVYQIASGGLATSPYAADELFTGGHGDTFTNTVDTSAVVNPAPQRVYQSKRTGSSGVGFAYTLPGLTPLAPYTVRLHFVESTASAPNARLFNVAINGTPVLTNFDIFATAGAMFTAVIEPFNVTADASGTINVAYTYGPAGNPLSSAIEVYAPGESAPDASTADATAPDASSAADTEAGQPDASSPDAGPPATEVYRIASGGPGTSPYAADAFFTGGHGDTFANTVDTSAVTNPAPQHVYQSKRTGSSGVGFSYALPGLTPLAPYTVRLHFVESTASAPNARLFNVAINGTPVLTSFDVFATAGGMFKAIAEQFNVTADAGGTINVAYTYGPAGNPLSSAIELFTPGSATADSGAFDAAAPDAAADADASPLDAAATNDADASGGVLDAPDAPDAPHATDAATGAPPSGVLDFSQGFTSPSGLSASGSAAFVSGTAQLTDGVTTNQAGSLFSGSPVGIATFTSDFQVKMANANADGFAFVVQAVGHAALGGPGGGLGYGPDPVRGGSRIPSSAAIKFDLYDNAGEGADSTGFFTNGAAPTIPAIDLSSSGIDLHSGNVFHVVIAYDGSTLTTGITDTVTNASVTQQYPNVNLPGLLAGPAYVGFTAGTGGATCETRILSWRYSWP
jgi:hypothetical protein